MATCIQPQTTPSCEICKLILNGDILEAKSTLSSLDKYEDVDGLSVFLLAKFYLNFLKEFSHSEGLGLSAAWTNEQVRKGEKRGEVFSLMKELLRHGVSSNTHHYGETPFLCAVSTHDTDFIRIILEHGADVNLKTLETKMNAIALTIILNDANILKLLFSFGAKVNGPCCQDLTPLQLSLNKSIDVSKVLLQNGADVQQVMQMQGREVLLTTPPLIHAVETDNLFLASILLEHGEDVNQGYGACSHSPIHFAIIRSNSDMVKLLIQYGANLNKRNGRGTTPLALVLSHCKGPMITTLTEALMSAGCSRTKGSPIAVFRKHYPPLHIAAFFGSDYHLEFIKRLIEMSDIVEMDRMNTLADNLQSCSLSYETDPIVGPSRQNLRRSLSCSERTSNLTIKEQQAFINTQAIDGSTALHMAVLGNNLAGAQFLISQGADPYISCQNGSLLHAAVMATQMGEELLKFVLKFNFDLNKKNDDGNTSLILASRKVTAGVCRLLIENGALLNVQDGRYGETALSTSVYFGFEDNAELLISHGASADLPDHRDTNAMYWAIFNCRERALRLLLQAGARLTRAELSTYPKNIKVMRNPELKALLYDYVSQPHSLQHLCRYGIRGHLAQTHGGRTIIPAVMSLPLPPPLKSFLALNTTS
ncbi:ankyrin repeat and SOCS box protein 14-like [Mya arenaria]|uniref:ankyrin repeat and SOCS box protein 14-like n=1 Tax=Mya arenaria TaxID=6604 RepID=UPI0022E4BCBB|nr:ankyrin repeat and SOCS box protein 14-like [Mya arenaria]